MRAAVIDIGSSSIKLIIGEKVDDQIKVLESLKNMVPLGTNAFLKERISQGIINQTIAVIERYKQVIKEYDVTSIKVIATNAVRVARNKDLFIDTVYRKTGFKIEVLNVGDVVYYIDSFLSLKLKKTYPIFEKNLLIAELGAGSLDISIMEKGYTLINFGIPIGTLRLKQFKGKIEGSLEEINVAMNEYIENELLSVKDDFPKLTIDDVILIDERYTSFVHKILPDNKVESNFFQLKQKEADAFLAKVTETNLDELARRYNIPTEVADTLDGYAIIVNTLLKLNKSNYIYILETSLPEALLANVLFNFELSKTTNKTNQLVSVANFLCRKYNVDLAHVKHVAQLSEILFNDLKEILGLEEQDSIYLILAGYLHDIGKFISNRSHHKHSEYIINSLNLFRLTDEDIKIIACIARYHRRSSPLPAHILYSSLSSDKQILVQKLSSLLRMANALDSSHKQKIKKLEVKINQKEEVSLVVTTPENFILEKANFFEKKELFEELSGNRIALMIKSQD